MQKLPVTTGTIIEYIPAKNLGHCFYCTGQAITENSQGQKICYDCLTVGVPGYLPDALIPEPAPQVIAGYECPACETFYKRYYDARDCCEPNEMFQCGKCEETWETERNAENCCKR